MFPVPAFVAMVLAWLAVRAVLSGARPLLVLLLAATAWQSLAVALVVGYGLDPLRPALPVTATAIPPLAWVTFRTGLFARRASIVPHAAVPTFTLFCVLFAPATLDVVVSGSFALYGAAILWTLRRSGDMPLARLDAGDMPARIWMALGWALILSAVTDAMIAAAYASGRDAWAGWIVTIFSSSALLGLGILSASPSASGPDEEPPQGASRSPEPEPATTEEDAAIVGRLDALLARDALHLDPDLTLARLARRLHVPEKRLSGAVNRATGGNVSRHINAWRIRHACGLLEAGQNVTEAMLESGFNTKSNFNREFRRVTGETPTGWSRAHSSAEVRIPNELADGS
jgi:AraC-like DNA-binding protein